MSLRFLADMNISPITVAMLREEGYDIVRVSSLLPGNVTDEEILVSAGQQERVVVTQDLDFSILLALSGYNRPSLATLRLTSTDPRRVAQRLKEVLPHVEQALAAGSAVTIEDTVVRIRKLPIH